MGAPKNKGYKRSWKNLLLNKQYQLSFTLLMVGLAAILMGVLGYWVNREAKRATQIFLNDTKDCRVMPKEVVPPPERQPTTPVEVDIGEMKMVEPGSELPDGDDNKDETTDGDNKGDGETAPAPDNGDTADGAAAAGAPVPAPAADGAGDTAAQPAPPPVDKPADPVAPPTIATTGELPIDPVCQKEQASKRQELLDGQRNILYVMIGVGLLLIFGLAFYGIKMTHHVAGPLHKVSLYLAKMKDGKFDTVYNLRKGDQLMDFYEHFKGAHAGVKKMQQEDLERLTEIIDAADENDLASKSPELKAALDELKAIAKRKEEGLV